MPHKHDVIDSDIRFTIDPYTRTMKDHAPANKKVVQYDHNSERYTFELPRFVEGHDMKLCNIVEVHYANVDKTTKEQNDGMCPIADLHISTENEANVVFSWLVSRAATQYVGPLKFSLYFACKEDKDDAPTYEWSTKSYDRISVVPNARNREVIDTVKQQTEDYIDRYGYEIPSETYILVDENGVEVPAFLVDEEVELTATANDIRLGTLAVTDDGVTEGTKEIPSYHTTEGKKYIEPGREFYITILRCEFTKFQALVCAFNKTLDDSVYTDRVSIDGRVYMVESTEPVSTVAVDTKNKKITLGIVNDSNTPYVLRYFTYKEEI